MNVRLDYPSGQSFSTSFGKFTVKVSHTRDVKRVHVSFRDSDNGKIYGSFSLPYKKGRQLAHALLAAAAGDLVAPIEFVVEDGARSKAAAA